MKRKCLKSENLKVKKEIRKWKFWNCIFALFLSSYFLLKLATTHFWVSKRKRELFPCRLSLIVVIFCLFLSRWSWISISYWRSYGTLLWRGFCGLHMCIKVLICKLCNRTFYYLYYRVSFPKFFLRVILNECF